MTRYTLIFLMIFLSPYLWAQSFTASVDNNQVGQNDNFQVTFTFEGKDINSIKNFSPPSFSNFRVLSGPNQSTSMQIINGVSSSSLAFSYVLMPQSMGAFTIGSASIQYAGQTYKSDPLKITVVKGSSKPKNDNTTAVSNEEIAKNLFIRATIDKSKVYQGEQVTVTYKLYTRLNIAAQMSVDKLPQYQGFWAEEIETPNNINFTTEVVDGRQFRVGILKKAALFPTQTGKLEVTPLALTIPIQVEKKRNPNNIWDDFFGDPFGRAQVVEYAAKSNTLKVDVIPLPDNNKPASFKGAVGRYDFSASLDKSVTKTNEPINLNLKITGTGNISLLDFPQFDVPNGFEKYDPKVDEQINRKGIINGSKEADYLLIPRIAGTREIPSIEFSYFDPAKRSYQTIKSKSFSVKIEQGTNIPSGPVASDQQAVQQLDTDIRYIKTSFNDIGRENDLLIERPGFWAATLLPFLAALGLIGWKRKQDKLSGNIQLLKYSKAEKVARKRFKKAKKYLEQSNIELFYSEISEALFGYLEDKFRIPKSEFTLDRASMELLNRKIPDTLVQKMRTNAEKCEYIRFAPGTDPKQAMNEMYKSLSEVVIDIERSVEK
jgi:hypothetical protein